MMKNCYNWFEYFQIHQQLRRNTWTSVANLNCRRLQIGVVVLENKLFIMGGREGLKTLNTVECKENLDLCTLYGTTMVGRILIL